MEPITLWQCHNWKGWWRCCDWSLPASNTDSDRTFSKIDSEERSHLERSTVASLQSLKLNNDKDGFEYDPHEELVKINKSAVKCTILNVPILPINSIYLT